MERIRYKAGYKYQLHEDYLFQTDIRPLHTITCDFIQLSKDGMLFISKGYCWDGASGPVPDTKRNMRAALIHDALYQLMRLELLDRRYIKTPADKIFMVICIQDGTYAWIAKGYYKGLKWFGKAATLPKNLKRVILAPN